MPIILLPVVGWAWPALLPVIGAAAAALGYKEFSDPKGLLRGRLTGKLENLRIESVPLDSVLTEVIADEIGREERLLFQRDDLVLVFRRDARGKFHVDVVGPREKTAMDLKLRAEEFARELIQKFAYHKIAEQLERAGATVTAEHIAKDGRITLRARKWR